MNDEEYVRSVWEIGRVMSFARVVLVGACWKCFDSWSAAAEFTRERLEQVRQLRETIKVVTNGMLRASNDSIRTVNGESCTLSKELEGAYAICAIRYSRAVLILEAELARLTQGMKEPQ